MPFQKLPSSALLHSNHSFTTKQCEAVQSPFMNVLLPKLCINQHVKGAMVWGSMKDRGLELKHMATEEIAKPI